jgi:hypothetical protein
VGIRWRRIREWRHLGAGKRVLPQKIRTSKIKADARWRSLRRARETCLRLLRWVS